MNWVEQAEEMMKSWADAQKTVLNGWYEMGRNAPGQQGASPTMPDLSAFLKPGLDAWTKGTGPTSEIVYFLMSAPIAGRPLLVACHVAMCSLAK